MFDKKIHPYDKISTHLSILDIWIEWRRLFYDKDKEKKLKVFLVLWVLLVSQMGNKQLTTFFQYASTGLTFISYHNTWVCHNCGPKYKIPTSCMHSIILHNFTFTMATHAHTRAREIFDTLSLISLALICHQICNRLRPHELCRSRDNMWDIEKAGQSLCRCPYSQ